MRRLADEGLQIGLAISLHAPNDELRSELMPINRRWPIAEVLAAADYYVERTGRRVSYEYTLMAGVNDSDAHADELARLLRGRLCHVNLIPLNPTEDPHAAGADHAARPGVRDAAAPGGHRRDDSRQPRPRHPGRVRPAAAGRKRSARDRTGRLIDADEDRAVDPERRLRPPGRRRPAGRSRRRGLDPRRRDGRRCSCPTSRSGRWSSRPFAGRRRCRWTCT